MIIRGHWTTPLRVKEDIEDVSSELGNGVRSRTSCKKRPELIALGEKYNKSRLVDHARFNVETGNENHNDETDNENHNDEIINGESIPIYSFIVF
ncbi:hypothetical protein TNCV_2586101 [Trichonephila clavipes]|nr:hypothetical protein TNCV_2586101 [Trichonephila clavipes]